MIINIKIKNKMNYIKNLLSIPSSLLLYTMGWSFINHDVKNLIHNNDKMVCVFSHTSYYDFFIMVLYYLSHPNDLCHLKTLIRPDYFDTFGPFLRTLGGIPATPLKDKGGGAVDRIVNELEQYEKFHFLISPKGTIVKGEWRSGYYHIANQLKCPIIALGLDYELKKIVTYQPINTEYDEIVIKNKLYQDLSNIVPLYPNQENMVIRSHLTASLVNKQKLCILILIVALFRNRSKV